MKSIATVRVKAIPFGYKHGGVVTSARSIIGELCVEELDGAPHHWRGV